MNKLRDFLSTDGPVFGFLKISGNIIIATIFWILGCIPVVTIGTSCAALYYCIMKSVRKDVGYVHKEFWRSYRINLKSGIVSTLIIAVFGFVFGYETILIGQSEMEMGGLWTMIARVVVVVGAMILMYLFPVISRFDLPLFQLWKLALVIAIRYFYYTIVLALGFALVVFVQLKFLPLPLILLTPGLWCYGTTFIVEKAMKPYIPKSDIEDEDQKPWYE